MVNDFHQRSLVEGGLRALKLPSTTIHPWVGGTTMRGRMAGVAAVAVAVAGTLILTACGSSKSDKPATSPGSKSGAPTDKKVEVFSWWSGGGEAAGLQAMIKDFNGKNPGVNFTNAAVAGGAGTNAKAVLESR